ncbi:hypothetical protein Cgig2_019414 [Carnegiea gigantea]|uniref:S-acyltransferase n=1 Tax=Carnegiea gigantea TaxID=171969 RepID=A0A9Q1QPB1_9CARY|nr:hypothetical protein Cgig2_019414 [Carnegiea gigantea]
MSVAGDFANHRPLLEEPPQISVALHLPTSEIESTKSAIPHPQMPEDYDSSFGHEYESICWGCGLRLILPSNAPISSAVGGGVWAVFPAVFSVSDLWGMFHSVTTFILVVATLSLFILAAFCDAGTPPPKVWGSYPAVQKDNLQDYTFCLYCSKPKSPRTHHCSSCGTCVLDMDHHCPFIGNCVGATNHRYFVGFLIMAVISVAYAAIMSGYAALQMLPPLEEGTWEQLHRVRDNQELLSILVEIFIGYTQSTVFGSSRGLVLVYLLVSSICVEIGLSVLLWQQLYFIYEGRTYLTSLTSQTEAERDCGNLCRFFGLAYPGFHHLWSHNFRKIHKMV